MQQLEIRDYQQRIMAKTIDAYTNQKLKSVLIESPTGSGKTVIMLMILKKLEELDPAMTFGWVAMRTKLLAQARQENERVGVKNIEFVSMFEKHPPKSKMIITDEAQHSAADTCLNLHHMMEAEISCGLTATPFRTDKIKLAYEKIISDCGVRFLIEKGYLSNFDQYVIPEFTPKTVVERFMDDPKRWGKSIFYFQTKELCFEAAEMLKQAGISCAVLLGSHPEDQREIIYSGFEDGIIQVLINVYLLTEGFDAPDLRSVWVRDSGKLCTMQMAGRSLRKDPKDPNKVANIIQSQNTYYPYLKVAKARRQFIYEDNRWMSIEPGPLIEQISELIRRKLFIKPVQIPRFLETGGSVLGVNAKGAMVVKRRAAQTGPSEESFILGDLED